MKGWWIIEDLNLDQDVFAILNQIKESKKVYAPDREADPSGRVPIKVNEEGFLEFPKYQSDDDVVISFKNYLNKMKIKKTDFLTKEDYAVRHNLLYNLGNNRHISSKTIQAFCNILNIRVDLNFVDNKKLMEEENND